MKGLLASVLLVVVAQSVAVASFLANEAFVEPPVLASGQTAPAAGELKSIHPSDPGSIAGIEGWSHGVTVGAGLEKISQPPRTALVMYEAERRIQQESAFPIAVGDVWEVEAQCEFPGPPYDSRAVEIELWAGAVSLSNPEQVTAGSELVGSFVVATTNWQGQANRWIPFGHVSVVKFTFQVPANSPLIGLNLVLSIRNLGGSIGASRWYLARLERASSAQYGGALDTRYGNGGAKISGLDATQPGSSTWTIPAPWEAATGHLRVSDPYSSSWVMLPKHMTGNGFGLRANTSNSLKWVIYPRSTEYIWVPIAAIVTTNATYFAAEEYVPANVWTTFVRPLQAKYWRRNHYLLGPVVSQATFANDLIGTQSVHLFVDYSSMPADTSISLAKFETDGAPQGGLTVNCSVITDGFVGSIGTSPNARQAYMYQYDQGVPVGRGRLVGSIGDPEGITIRGAIPGTFETYSDGDQFLRTHCGTVTIPVSVDDPMGGTIRLRNGDIDDDGSISVFDYIALSDSFDSAPGEANWDPRADLDGDSVISIFDYIILSDNFDLTDDL